MKLASKTDNDKTESQHTSSGDKQRESPPLYRSLLRNSPSWLASLVTHVVLLVVLGLWLLPELPALVTADLNVSPSDIQEQLEENIEFETDPVELEEEIVEYEEQPETTLIEENVSFAVTNDLESAPAAEIAVMDVGSDIAPLLTVANALGGGGSGLSGRGHMARAVMVRKGGGNAASETAVGLALAWIAEHQNPDGSWSFDHTQFRCQGRCRNPGSLNEAFSGGTAMALLPFLGAGNTNNTGNYQHVVSRGLLALVSQLDSTKHGGSLIDSGNMYSHGLAAIALCEAYGMTNDIRLQKPAQLALNFIAYAQDPVGGGWRYGPKQPGDTSVVGWQIMALKSGHMSYLMVPASTVHGASVFLDAAQVDGGAGYCYEPGLENTYKPTTSAIGLLCRMYLGWKHDNEKLTEGVKRIAAIGPSTDNVYYNYYAAQLLFQYTGGEGELWETWNTKLRNFLIDAQAKEGHEKGSWFLTGHHSGAGGRLYSTAMCCMTLEVYYRHMPIYQRDAVEADFPEE
jgi:hypothetical protein